MVGHTGVLPAVIAGVEASDAALGVILAAVEQAGGIALVTADHGNAEQMLEPDGSPHTAHTTNPVPLVVTVAGAPLRAGGKLGDLAPTVLALLGVSAPLEMTGREPAGAVGSHPRGAAVLRERDFALFFWGQAVSVLGDGIFPIALAFAVLELGGSPTELGLVLVAGILPQVLFVLVGGVWADRLPRRTIMIAADAVRALVQAVTAVLLLSGEARIWQLAVLYALHATASAFFNAGGDGARSAGHAAGSVAAGQRAARHDAKPRGRPGRGARRRPCEPGLDRRRGGARRLHIRRERRLPRRAQPPLGRRRHAHALPERVARRLRRGAQASLAVARPDQRVPLPHARRRAVRGHRARWSRGASSAVRSPGG